MRQEHLVRTAGLALLLVLPAPLLAAGLADRLPALVDEHAPAAVVPRHDIHQHPERSYQEGETGKRVAAELQRLGLEVRTGVAKTGVVGVLRGGRPGAGGGGGGGRGGAAGGGG